MTPASEAVCRIRCHIKSSFMPVVVTVVDGQQAFRCLALSSSPTALNTMESFKPPFSALLLSGLSSVATFLSPFSTTPETPPWLGGVFAPMMKSTHDGISLRGQNILVIAVFFSFKKVASANFNSTQTKIRSSIADRFKPHKKPTVVAS